MKVPQNRVRKKPTIKTCEAEVVSLIYSLFVNGDEQSGPMGTRRIANHLNTKGLLRRKQLWTPAKVRETLTDPTYMGNRIFGQRKPETEQVLMDVPPIVDRETSLRPKNSRCLAAEFRNHVRSNVGTVSVFTPIRYAIKLEPSGVLG
ncbi:recombinase family protein [Shimia thalassica]|uniref:recombinase family protein n=1 Tax=Shimia thalassica TaxID=1715693 RepID=UPI0026E15B58|nr:recombinase family protein [Shimia thalassica]MDO6485223.1 recombinase family protein [Shimia thalassica]